jgi:hypothetical protein
MKQAMRVVRREGFRISSLLLLAALALAGRTRVAGVEPPSVFEMPGILARRATHVQSLRSALAGGNYAVAERQAQEVLKLIPFDQDALYNLLRAQALQGKADEALESLRRLLALGVRDIQILRQDPRLGELRKDERFEQLLKNPPTADDAVVRSWTWNARPANPQGGEAWVSSDNTTWNGQQGVFLTSFDLRTQRYSEEPIKEQGRAGELIREWHRLGTAAGNRGDYYDNYDAGHSALDVAQFPQLLRIRYSAEVERHDFHRGLQTRFFFIQSDERDAARMRSAVVIGNSSTAITDPVMWRSLPRLAYADPRATMLLYAQYCSNHLYVYPEHRDHDPGHNGVGDGHGDVFPANTPYLLISQGSSGSDRPFLEAVACTLAALRPDVKQHLADHQALIPTVQMVLRRNYRPVATDSDYLSGAAHPTVFEGALLNVERMTAMAQEVKRGFEPPLVRLQVVEEDEAVVGKDYFHIGTGDSEKLFDTPGAIARIYRTLQSRRRIVVSAEASRDLNGQPLKFHWVILRGDPARISIKTSNEEGSRAELTIGYHVRSPIATGSAIASNRVDIGVFAHNGTWFSAPAFVTHFFLDNENRTYGVTGLVERVDYDDRNYVDPALDVAKRWSDEYRYDSGGRCLGWVRRRLGAASATAQEFTAEGKLVISGSLPSPSGVAEVEYFVVSNGKRRILDYRTRVAAGSR